MISVSGTLSKGWMNRAIGVVFDREYYFDVARRYAVDSACNEYALDTFGEMGLFYSESNLGQIAYWDEAQVLIGGIQPNLILGMLVGAEFVAGEDKDADITGNCLAGRDPAEMPGSEVLLEHELIGLFDEQIAAVRRGDYGPLRAIPPFFWDASGRATIHGVLTTAQKLWGEGVFMDMVAEPEKCMAMMEWVTEAYVVLCRHFAEVADMAITSVHVGECSCCTVGAELVERFVVPATARIGRELGSVRFHSCGTSTHLIETFGKIAGLQSLDLGGKTSVSRVREVFGREMAISTAPEPELMSAESAEPILDWAKQVLEENAGGDLQFLYHLEPSYSLETTAALTDFVKGQEDFRDARSIR